MAIALILATVIDLGTFGETSPILEENLLVQIENSTRKVAKIRVEPKKWIGKNFPETRKHAVIKKKLTVEAKKNYEDSVGNIIVKKGTTKNVLETRLIEKPLLLIDGTKTNQIDLAQKKYSHATLILCKGNPIELSKKTSLEVFFDQGGDITRELELESVPSLVSQVGDWLKIEYIPVKDN